MADIGIDNLNKAICDNKSIQTIIDLIGKVKNINDRSSDGWLPLENAVLADNLNIVKALLNYGARADMIEDFILTTAGDDIALELIKAGANVNAEDNNGQTLLFGACQSGNLEMLNTLLGYDIDINKQDIEGFTPLMYACQEGHQEIIKRLIQAKADIDIVNEDKYTALMLCSAANPQIEAAEILLKSGANFNKRNINGSTALILASQYGNVDIVKLLLSYGADINAAYPDGRTALMCACFNGEEEVVSVLIKSGADISLKDKAGNTALSVAQNNASIIKLLKEVDSKE